MRKLNFFAAPTNSLSIENKKINSGFVGSSDFYLPNSGIQIYQLFGSSIVKEIEFYSEQRSTVLQKTKEEYGANVYLSSEAQNEREIGLKVNRMYALSHRACRKFMSDMQPQVRSRIDVLKSNPFWPLHFRSRIIRVKTEAHM